MWFKFNPSELLRRWPYRSLDNFGAYCTLYCLAWDNLGLPDDVKQAVNLSGLNPAVIEQVFPLFREHCEPYLGKLMPPEMVQGIQRYRDKAESGKRSIEKRWKEEKNVSENDHFDGNKGLADTVPNRSCNTDIDIDLDKELEEERETEIAVEAKVQKSRKSAPAASPVSDEEWLESLQSNEAYKHISVRMAYARMQAWCKQNRKQPTRRRFINWLNREKPPVVSADISITDTPADKSRRFVMKACGVWDDREALNKFYVQDVVRVASAIERDIGSFKSPVRFREFWHEALRRNGNPKPDAIIEQKTQYLEWLAQNE